MNFKRQQGIFPPEIAAALPVTLIGVGGIGSATLIMLAKVGFTQIAIVDDDLVKEANVPHQLLWGPGDLGKLKVEVAAERVLELMGTLVRTYPCSFPSENLPPLAGIVIAAVDSIEVRKQIWEKTQWNANISLYVDPRTGVGPNGQWLEVHSVRPTVLQDIEYYEQHLHPTADIDPQLTCNAFLPVNLIVASFVTYQIRKWAMRKPYHQRVVLEMETMNLLRQEIRDPKPKRRSKL